MLHIDVYVEREARLLKPRPDQGPRRTLAPSDISQSGNLAERVDHRVDSRQRSGAVERSSPYRNRRKGAGPGGLNRHMARRANGCFGDEPRRVVILTLAAAPRQVAWVMDLRCVEMVTKSFGVRLRLLVS